MRSEWRRPLVEDLTGLTLAGKERFTPVPPVLGQVPLQVSCCVPVIPAIAAIPVVPCTNSNVRIPNVALPRAAQHGERHRISGPTLPISRLRGRVERFCG